MKFSFRDNLSSKRIVKASDGKFDWSCLMVDYPEELVDKVISWGKENIPDEKLYDPKDSKRTFGREKHIHSTVLYGIDPKVLTEQIKKIINNKPIKVTLGEISKFDNKPEYDVIKISVEGKDLRDLHKAIEDKIGAPGNEFPEYIPHTTIAYVKKDSCDELLGQSPFADLEFELDTYDFSNPDASHEKIVCESSFVETIRISSRDVVAIDTKRWTERKRRQMAYNSKDPQLLNQLSKDKFESVRRNVAENDAAPPEALLYLSKDPERDVRYMVSRHKNTPPDALRHLANEIEPMIRTRVAWNKNTPSDVLEKLFLNSDGEMKKAIAENPNSPESVLFKIFKQKDPSIRNRLTRNPKCPTKLLEAFTRSKSAGNRERVAENPNSTPEILAILAKDRDNDVRGNIAHNPKSTDKILEYLSHDRDSYVVYAVAENTNTPQKTLYRLLKENSGEDGDHDVIRYMCKNERISGELLKKIFDTSRSFQTYVVEELDTYHIPQQYKTYFLKNYLERRERKTENTEKDVHITTPEIGDGDELYEALLKRQEIQYKFDALKEYYKGKPAPDDSKLPILEFQLNAVNQTLMKYMYSVIYDWRRTRVNDRENRIKEMTQNEAILSELKAARNSRDTDKQRLAIEKALNTIHSSGQMIEHYGLEKYLLDYASNMDTTKWDRQLEHMASKKFSSRG